MRSRVHGTIRRVERLFRVSNAVDGSDVLPRVEGTAWSNVRKVDQRHDEAHITTRARLHVNRRCTFVEGLMNHKE